MEESRMYRLQAILETSADDQSRSESNVGEDPKRPRLGTEEHQHQSCGNRGWVGSPRKQEKKEKRDTTRESY
jgi:hypothetical protein